MGILSWFRKPSPPSPPHAPVLEAPLPGFVCADCGRTDLPEAGGWDPPICLECDAAINEDALVEAGAYEDDDEG